MQSWNAQVSNELSALSDHLKADAPWPWWCSSAIGEGDFLKDSGILQFKKMGSSIGVAGTLCLNPVTRFGIVEPRVGHDV